MSGSRSKSTRKADRERPAHIVNADYAKRSADAALGTDLSAVPLSRVNQFAIGWMRAAFEQSRVIAELTAAGMGHLAAPNRRAFWELALRLLWLGDMPQSERAEAVDTMLAHDRTNETTTDRHMHEMGLPSDIDVEAMKEWVFEESTDKARQHQAKNLTAAARSTDLNSGVIYRLWREDSSWAHATGSLAGHYAPERGATVGKGTPPTVDPNLEAHRLTCTFIVFTTGYILAAEGVPSELATAVVVAFHEVR